MFSLPTPTPQKGAHRAGDETLRLAKGRGQLEWELVPAQVSVAKRQGCEVPETQPVLGPSTLVLRRTGINGPVFQTGKVGALRSK